MTVLSPMAQVRARAAPPELALTMEVPVAWMQALHRCVVVPETLGVVAGETAAAPRPGSVHGGGEQEPEVEVEQEVEVEVEQEGGLEGADEVGVQWEAGETARRLAALASGKVFWHPLEFCPPDGESALLRCGGPSLRAPKR